MTAAAPRFARRPSAGAAGLALVLAASMAEGNVGAARAEDLSRHAQACEYAAQKTLVGTMTFERTGVDDSTLTGGREVDIPYNATSKETGKVYPEEFECLFDEAVTPDNLLLEQAANNGALMGESSVRALNTILREAGFQKK